MVKLPAGEHLNFISGGYIQIDIPKYDLKFTDFDIEEQFRGDKGMETVRKNVGEEGFSKIKNAGAEAVKKTEDAAKNLMGDDWVKMTKDRAKDVIK